MSDRIEEIRARWAKANEYEDEPLRFRLVGTMTMDVRCNDGSHITISGTRVEPHWSEGDVFVFCEMEEHAEAIAHAPEDIAYLLAELEAAREAYAEAMRAAGESAASREAFARWQGQQEAQR